MAWNEPGGSRDKDPWGGQGGNDQGPPDLDEVMKKLQDKLGGLFGGGSRGTGGGASQKGLISLILAGILVIWGMSGIYTVQEGTRGVVMQLGAYHETTEPGLHWIPRFIQSVEVVNVENVGTVEIGTNARESNMLTQDENIVDIHFIVQYRIKSAQDFVFNVRDPITTLKQATESALREVVGQSSWDRVTTEGRGEIAARIKNLLQAMLDDYRTGIVVTSVNMQRAAAPRQVKDAFDDVIKAREDKESLENEAEAYANDILPKARGTASRQLQEAEAYKAKVIAEAEGEATRFNQVLKEYNKAPRVTRERLYLETMEEIYANSKKVVVDVKGGNSMLYLPLDQIMKNQRNQMTAPLDSEYGGEQGSTYTKPQEPTRPTRDVLRGREVR